jgi:hypothetical protein
MFLQRLRTRIVSWAIRDSVPVLNLVRRPKPWPPLSELRDYEEGSFGREVAGTLTERGLPFLPSYENHDAIHVLLDYDTNACGELELQAFLVANGTASFAGHVLFVWGAVMLPEHVTAMRAAFRRGRRASRLVEERFPERLHEPLTVLRAELERA